MGLPLIFAILSTLGAGGCFAAICCILYRVIACASADSAVIGCLDYFGLTIIFATLIWNVACAIHYIRILFASED